MSRAAVARCGTPSGYQAHKRKGETPCAGCARARREYDQRNKNAPEKTVKNRLHAKAQNRAYVRLAAAHREDYRALYQEEKERVFLEAGWSQRPGPPVWRSS